jgi:phosphoribosylformylglycinamidine (FGAM) synthase-like amidotransferase family enzyme
MNAAVIVFPGSNCDRDVASSFNNAYRPIGCWSARVGAR